MNPWVILQVADGRLLPINQNTAVFSLLGTTFGGDGTTTFALPDLRAFAPAGIAVFDLRAGVLSAAELRLA